MDSRKPTSLVERAEPLAALDAMWAEARGGHGLVVFVGGEAGIGKTSVIRELARRVGDAAVLVGACDALSTPRPLGPLSDVAGALPAELGRAIGAGKDVGSIFSA